MVNSPPYTFVFIQRVATITCPLSNHIVTHNRCCEKRAEGDIKEGSEAPVGGNRKRQVGYKATLFVERRTKLEKTKKLLSLPQ